MSKWKEIAEELKRLDAEEKQTTNRQSSNSNGRKKVEFERGNQMTRNRRESDYEPERRRRLSSFDSRRSRENYYEPERRRMDFYDSERKGYMEPERRRTQSPIYTLGKKDYSSDSENEFLAKNYSKSNLYRVNRMSEFMPYYNPMPEQPLLKLRQIVSQHRYPFYQSVIFRTPPNYFHN